MNLEPAKKKIDDDVYSTLHQDLKMSSIDRAVQGCLCPPDGTLDSELFIAY